MVYIHIEKPQPQMEAKIKRKKSDKLKFDDGFANDSKKRKRDSQECDDKSKVDGGIKIKRNKAVIEVNSTEEEVLQALVKSIKAATNSEVQIFTAPAENPEEDKLNPHFVYNTLASYPDVLCELVEMFVKLRRFPKLIAKLLCCFRECIFKERHFQTALFPIELLLPIKFVNSMASVISSLPIGQLTDLLKTLYHNLLEECVKPICEKQGKNKHEQPYVYFLTIVSDLYCEYLTNIKVADHTVQMPVIEKVIEMMQKLREECLSLFGNEIINRLQGNSKLVTLFLKLAHTYGELHGFLIYYKNDMYKSSIDDGLLALCNSDSSPENMTFLHEYMSVNSWKNLHNQIYAANNEECKYLWVMLVVQKLKYMLVLRKPPTDYLLGTSTTSYESILQVHIKTTVKYILSQQEFCKLSLPDLYALTYQYLDENDIIELVKYTVKHGSLSDNEILINNPSLNNKFESVFVIETINFIFTRMTKMKVLPKWCRKIISHDIFSLENKLAMINNFTNQKIGVYEQFLMLVNDLIQKSVDDDDANIDEPNICSEITDFVNDEIIKDKLKILSAMNLEYYPSYLKTVIALSSAVILLSIISATQQMESPACAAGGDDIIESIVILFIQTASESKGNVTLFGIHWTKFYNWLYKYSTSFSSDLLRKILQVILKTIYMSAKSIETFDVESNFIHDHEIVFDSSSTAVRLGTLEFLLQELPISIQAKSKLTPQIQSKIKTFTISVAKALKKSTTGHRKSPSNSNSKIEISQLSNIFQASWLTQLALPTFLDESSSSNETEEIFSSSKLKRICCKHVESAFDILINAEPNFSTKQLSNNNNDLKSAKIFALIFLHTICKTRNEVNDRLPDNFIQQLFHSCLKVSTELWNDCTSIATTSSSSSAPSQDDIRKLPKYMFDVSTVQEFSELKTLILEKMTTLVSSNNNGNQEENEMENLFHILDCLLDSNLIEPEKKNDRREILDGILCSILQLSCHWNYSNVCLTKIVLPILRFEVKLLQRRIAICGQTTAATCLSSITSLPLHAIENIKLYGEIFSTAAEVLNAFTIHRLDVLSFRMHIYVQCFQFLIENVTSRANQENKLTDEEITRLKYCTHRIERTCQSMKLNQKDFSKVSPYVMAIMMRQFEMFTVYPAVKEPLLNGCYKLLDLCDSHGVAQLNSMLTVGSRETFKSVYEIYNKFYKYKGQV